MKIIITERQRKLISEDEDRDFLVKKKTAKKYLTKKFGDLIPYETEKYPETVFYVDDGKNVYIEYNKKNGKVWIDYDTIWSFLMDVFSFNNRKIQQVTKEWLEEHYKLDVTTTHQVELTHFRPLEEHYKLDVTTTYENR